MSEVIEQTEEIEVITEEPVIEYPYVVAVKFKNASKAYSFGTDSPDFVPGEWVVVETAQGLELGEVQAQPLSTEKFPIRTPLKPVLRKALDQDKRNYEENFAKAEEAFKVCNEEIASLGLEMNLLSADYTLDRSKVLFVYLAEQRVDFRELLKRLGSRLHCRIELRQIGERDKAKMVGGIGMCGMECCCSRFKSRFDVISINMAKNQLLALNIEKLSGMCGKLMCCLKYEDENYKELTAGLPKMGAHVEYEDELYRVTSINVMTNEAKIENAESVQILTIDELREKTQVRKGVSTPKRVPGRRPQKISVAAKVIENNEQRRELSASVSEPLAPSVQTVRDKQRPAMPKPAFLNAKNNKQPAVNVNKTENAGAANKGQKNANNGNNRRNNNNNNHHRSNQRPKSMDTTKNPNMTVRSFKSSRSKEKEASKGA
ncbi:MAG: regulatory iron-sulfur-containing complex subunit RicT [Erysipelotrichaceae bacterium]|nr:regulatory iron-sulfur-containing complex subunit RicT [Erysipelotrichaceae bacterium]